MPFGLERAEGTRRQPGRDRPQQARLQRQVGREHAIEVSRPVDERDIAESLIGGRGGDGEGHRERRGDDGDARAVHVRARGQVRPTQREERWHQLRRLPQPSGTDEHIGEADLVRERRRIVEREHHDVAELRRQIVDGATIELAAVVQEHGGIRTGVDAAAGLEEAPGRHEAGAVREAHAIHGVAPPHPDERRLGRGRDDAPDTMTVELGR
ncbi:MAG TPA: hypothetical protein VFY16_12650 [Gemmatimonadaceae bacterium]|nr:hypothetical protein [Gemmatimonadaceae bacterium]